ASTGLIALFDDVHMLKNLGFGFALVAAQGATVAGMRFFAAPVWGRIVDRAGARPVMVATALGLSVTPLLWLLATPARWWPVALDALVAGTLWSGFNLAMFSLQLALAPPLGRRLSLAGFSTAS